MGTEKINLNIQKEQIEVVIYLDKRRLYLIRANPGHTKPWNALRYALLQTASRESEESFATIRLWIDVCESNHSHEQCARQADASLPR